MNLTAKPPKIPKKIAVKIELTKEIDLSQYISGALKKFGARTLFWMMSFVKSFSITKAYFPMSMIASKDDVEDIQFMLVCKYIYDNWDAVEKKATKHYAACMKEVDERKRKEK